jgi:hypothetical protein
MLPDMDMQRISPMALRLVLTSGSVLFQWNRYNAANIQTPSM